MQTFAGVPASQRDFYQRLRGDMRAWLDTRVGRAHKLADVLCCAPDLLHLLCRLSLDERIPLQQKARLGATIAYFLAPMDAMPEMLVGPAGYMDDVALAAQTLTGLLTTNRDVLAEHWAGDRDLVEVLQSVARAADGVIGAGLWRNIRSKMRQRLN